MRILPKKRFRLRARDGSVYDTEPLVIQDIDDKFASCRMFQLGKEDGDIDVLDTKAAQKKAENSTPKPSRKSKKAEPKPDENPPNDDSPVDNPDDTPDGKEDGDIDDPAGNDGNDAV